MELVCSVDGGEVMGSCLSFECGLFRVLGTFNALFQGAFKTVPVGDANASMLLAEIMVWPDYDIFVVWISFDLIIWSMGKGVSTICSPRLIFEYDVVLLPFREVSCDMWSNFAGIVVISEICVVGVYYDGDGGSFEQVGPAAESSHNSQKFLIIDWVILFSGGEFLRVETTWASCSRLLCSIC
jgi:hypothetical protein